MAEAFWECIKSASQCRTRGGRCLLQEVFGAEEVFRTGPFNVDDAFMKGKLAPRELSHQGPCFSCVRQRYHVELFEYEGEDKKRRRSARRKWAVRTSASRSRMVRLCQAPEGHGCRNAGRPNVVDAGPLEGFKWVYFRAPWGQILEIASFDKLGYEKDHGQALVCGGEPVGCAEERWFRTLTSRSVLELRLIVEFVTPTQTGNATVRL